MAWGERSERAMRASEALWCFLWVSMAHCACTALLLSGTFLCLLLLLWVLLLLLVLLPLVGNFGPLQLHASTTFKNVRASRSLLRQVFFVGPAGVFLFFFEVFCSRRFSKVFSWMLEGFSNPKWVPKPILEVFFATFFFEGILESILPLLFEFFLKLEP